MPQCMRLKMFVEWCAWGIAIMHSMRLLGRTPRGMVTRILVAGLPMVTDMVRPLQRVLILLHSSVDAFEHQLHRSRDKTSHLPRPGDEIFTANMQTKDHEHNHGGQDELSSNTENRSGGDAATDIAVHACGIIKREILAAMS